MPVQASFPELGFETAVEAASSTSPPPDSQPAWKGEVSNKFEPINDFDTNLSTMYDTSPIEIFRLGQNLSVSELHSGTTSFAAKVFILPVSYTHLTLPTIYSV